MLSPLARNLSLPHERSASAARLHLPFLVRLQIHGEQTG